MDLIDQNKRSWLSLLDYLDEEISIHSADGQILYTNRRMLESGGAAIEWLGRRCEEVFHEDGCPHEEALETRLPAQTEIHANGLGDGRKVTVVPLLGATAEVEGYARIAGRQM